LGQPAKSNFTIHQSEITLDAVMRLIKKFLPLLLLSFTFVGCETAKITNVTPGRMERNEKGLYPVEAAFETRQQAFRRDSLKPQVIVGLESHPMQPVPVVKNRFEASIPVPANEKTVRYRFKFDYNVGTVTGVTRPDSKLSPEYTLDIVDKK
jgi:hypothetical protein